LRVGTAYRRVQEPAYGKCRFKQISSDYDRYKVLIAGSVPVQSASGETKVHFRIEGQINAKAVRSWPRALEHRQWPVLIVPHLGRPGECRVDGPHRVPLQPDQIDRRCGSGKSPLKIEKSATAAAAHPKVGSRQMLDFSFATAKLLERISGTVLAAGYRIVTLGLLRPQVTRKNSLLASAGYRRHFAMGSRACVGHRTDSRSPFLSNTAWRQAWAQATSAT
jgi:hypothetical protein